MIPVTIIRGVAQILDLLSIQGRYTTKMSVSASISNELILARYLLDHVLLNLPHCHHWGYDYDYYDYSNFKWFQK